MFAKKSFPMRVGFTIELVPVEGLEFVRWAHRMVEFSLSSVNHSAPRGHAASPMNAFTLKANL
jgi:hypothetical protein|tara:strand:+ start:721 stop:909 length:189 start_codon:yes stop_codon:yes gene_type:complete